MIIVINLINKMFTLHVYIIGVFNGNLYIMKKKVLWQRLDLILFNYCYVMLKNK